MSRNGLRFALVALALAVTTSVLGAGMEDATDPRRASFQDNSRSEKPTLQIDPSNETITERNATTFLVHLGNPPWNDYPKYVVLRVWSPNHDTLGLKVNDESPDVSFDQGVGWEFHHDLDPGRHTIYTVTVERGSEPGSYSIFAAGMFVEDGVLTTGTAQANLSIEAGPPLSPPSLCEQVVEFVVATIVGFVEFVVGILIWMKTNPVKTLSILLTAIGVFAGISQLLIALYGKERFIKGVQWPVHRFRDDEPRSGDPEQDDLE